MITDSVSDPRSYPIPVTVADGGNGGGKPYEQLSVQISPGLEPATWRFDVGRKSRISGSVDLSRKLAATEMTAQAPLSEPPFLRLAFNGHVAQSALQQIISVDPKIDFTLQSSPATRPIRCSAIFSRRPATPSPSRPTPHGTGPGLDGHPTPGHLSAFVPDRQSGVWLDNDQGYLSSAGNRTLLAHTMNVDAVRVAVTRVYDNNLVQWQNTGRAYSWNGIDNYAKPLAEKTFPLANEKNVQHDVRISLDELLPPACPRDGVYRLQITAASAAAAADDDDEDNDEGYRPYTYAVVTLSDIGLTAKEVRGGLLVWATSIRSAQPIGNIHIRAFSNKNQPLGEATTDATGLARISDIHPAQGESLAVILADRAPPPLAPPAPRTGILGPEPPTTWYPAPREGAAAQPLMQLSD